MSFVHLLLTALFALIALVAVLLAIIRAIGNNKRWKEIEPHMIKGVENLVGQPVLFKTMQNANHSTDFRNGKDFWLWMAFTKDYAAFVRRDEVAEKGEGDILISRRKDTSIKPLEKYYAEIEVRNRDTAKTGKFILLINKSHYEALTQFISVK